LDLIGRVNECAQVDELLASARCGLGGTLVIRGDAGIGKTALIEYAIRSGDDFLLIRLTGVEAEREIAFAALHRLLTPILHQIERLPPPQRDALNSALGLAEGPPADRFLLGLGVLSLAANAVRAVKRMLCVFDDAHWIDRETLDVLAFWGRRLHADGTAVLFAERDEPAMSSPLDGFPMLHLDGLNPTAARQLLSSVARPDLDADVADRLIADTRGNPLALLELGKDLTADQLIGAVAGPSPLPMSRQLEQRFVRKVRALPVETQMMLLLCAADSSGEAALLWRAAAIVGLTPAAADPAEAEQLVVLDTHVTFRHPLIRSAVYGNARPADRRAVHRALAAAIDTKSHADRRAWHLAAATVGRDEQVALTLERCAVTANERGGHSSGVALLSRAAELSPDPQHAARRRVAAAAEALDGGAPLQTQALIAAATPDLRDPVSLAAARRLEGAAWMRLGQPRLAAPILLSAAESMLDSAPTAGRRTLLEALEAALVAGGGEDTSADVGGSVAALAKRGPTGTTVVDLLLDGFAIQVADGFVAAAPRLRRAVSAMKSDHVDPQELIRWSRFASDATRELWDHDAHDALMVRLARVIRARGALDYLALTLQSQAISELWQGKFAAADSYSAQAADVSSAAGGGMLTTGLLGLSIVAHRGHEIEARAQAANVMQRAAETGVGLAATIARMALVVLDLGLGQYGDALAHAEVVFEEDPVPFGNEVLPNMIEAAIRAGNVDAANDAMTRLAERAPAAGTAWASGLHARSRALLAGDDGDAGYLEAIDLLASTRQVVESARTHLLYGEWLRRQKRRGDARDQLRIAYDMFASMGAEAFAKRAQAELLATGERARKRNVETANDLTPQETQVAELAAAGATNAEIAAQLFLSQSTVEYHLRKVFRKLALTSRRQLKRALPTN